MDRFTDSQTQTQTNKWMDGWGGVTELCWFRPPSVRTRPDEAQCYDYGDYLGVGHQAGVKGEAEHGDHQATDTKARGNLCANMFGY